MENQPGTGYPEMPEQLEGIEYAPATVYILLDGSLQLHFSYILPKQNP